MQGLQLQYPESKATNDVVSQAIETPLPLSPLQEGMLFQSLLSDRGGDCFYIMQRSVELREPVEKVLVETALTALLNRHPAVSASFHAPMERNLEDGLGRPYQRFHKHLRVPVEVVTLATTDTSQRKVEFEQFLLRDRNRGFDLAAPPLVRATIVKDDSGVADFVLTFHHILMDGRSVSKFIHELFELITAYCEERAPKFGPEPRSYCDYLKFCTEKDHSQSVDYFRKLLAGKSTPTTVPLAEPVSRPLAETGYGEVTRTCCVKLFASARKLAEQTQTTVGTVVQAMWSIVLSRFSGEQDVIFGNTRAGRGAFGKDAADMVGLFINTVAIRADVDNDRSVKDLLHALREQSINIRPHETIPLSAVIQASEIGPGIALFETLLVFEDKNLGEALIELGGDYWKGRSFHTHQQPPFPLTLNFVGGSQPELRMLFDRSRLSERSIHRLLESCEQTLKDLALDPNRKLAEIDVLLPAERRKLLFEWNDTSRPFSDQACIYELFEARVDEQPFATALEYCGTVLNYRELEERANRLAQVLILRGVEPGQYVGICLSRGFDLVTSMLAVVKAGAAYVPLDPNYPAERLSLMLSDVDAALVITERKCEGVFDHPRIVLDGIDKKDWNKASSARPARRTSPENQCYTIFTSGSTGTPKGVVLTHRAVVNTLEWVNREFKMLTSDRLLFVTSHCFDLSVYDVFGMLGAGGTVVIATEDVLAEPQRLANLLVDTEITVWDSAPAALQRLVPFFPERGGNHLRLCMLSGDWIPLSLPGAIRAAFPRAQVMSLGGATEAAIWSNWYPVGEIKERWVSIPYGKPIQNARYHVLDQRMEPVPIGVCGDLYIGGACLASGYHGRSQLTEERFVSDPFRPGQKERLYKTGDLARYTEDGNLEFLGRSDHQVKIRGFRVELGEVEAVISHLDGVRAAVCTAYADAVGVLTLVAYVLPKKNVKLEEETIKNLLSKKLPSFMVPSQIIFLDGFPVTSNGKLDRASLPDPRLSSESGEFVIPKGEIELELSRMWCELLEKDRVSVRDHFFTIGGHSLLAVHLIAKIRHTFKVDLPLVTLLSNPTIRELAPYIGQKRGTPQPSRHLHAFNREGSRIPMVLIPGIVGTPLTFNSLQNTLGSEQPIFVVDLFTIDSAENFPDTIEEMAALYEEEILEACGGSPIILGGFSFGALIAFELARRFKKRGCSVPLLISFDGFAPGYPNQLPLTERFFAIIKELLKKDNRERFNYLKNRNIFRRMTFKGPLQVEGINDEVIDQELQYQMNELLEIQYRAREVYRPEGESEELAMLLIRAEEMPYFGGVKLTRPHYGWEKYIHGPISLITFPGNHYQIWLEENRVLISNAIVEQIDQIKLQLSGSMSPGKGTSSTDRILRQGTLNTFGKEILNASLGTKF